MWLALSLAWIAFWSWRDNVPCLLGFDLTGTSPWCKTGLYLAARPRIETAELVLGAPFAGAVVLTLLAWIAAGFRNTN
ncbi:hypothetical protein ABID26_004075 [Mesorhizobium shonense]|uniref:Uncharacterized protein n=1 Tax=Mesorhizobium shonense TaxID=1209948 RepID=A0ABV2HX38_9HYPH